MNVSRETISILDYLGECYKSYMSMMIHESFVYSDIDKDGYVIYRRMFNHNTGKAMSRIAADIILRGEY